MRFSPRDSQRLAAVLRDAVQFVPFYRDFWGQAGIDVQRLTLTEFESLPVVRKSDLLSSGLDSRLDSRYAARKLLVETTSGSTGQPLQLRKDRRTTRRRQLRFLGALLRCGYRPWHSVMLVSSRPAHAIRSVSPWARCVRWHYVDLYEGQERLWHEFERLKPDVLYGPLSALLLLARALEAQPSEHHPSVVVSTAEQLGSSARRRLKSAFRTDVADFYGTTELGPLAWKAAGSLRYETQAGASILEFLPSGDGSSGFERLVVTDLNGGAMPLIRYDTGDLVRRDAAQSGCPIVEISGRQVDFLVLPDGGRVSPYHVDELLGELAGVTRYVVVQQPDLNVEVRIAAHDSDPALLERARAGLAALCGGQLAVRAQFADFPPPEGHKLRPVQSLARTP